MKRHVALTLLFAAACGGDDGGNTTGDDGGGTDGGGSGSDGGSGTCTRTAGPANGQRYIALGRPFAASGAGSGNVEILKLSETGEVTQFSPPQIVTLGGRATYGTFEFTPNGRVALIALSDLGVGNPSGAIGVISLDANGTATVVHARFTGSFTASSIVMQPDGAHAYVIDRNVRENGGGVYSVAIACDGTLTDEGMLFAAKSPGGLVLDGNRALLSAVDALDRTTAGDDVHILSLGNPITRTAGGDAFGDDNFVFGGAALTADKGSFLVGDNKATGANRVAVVNVTASAITPNAVLTGIVDPEAIVASPFGNVAVVTAVQGNKIHILDKGGANNTWRIAGQPAYMGANPQLPADIATVTEGTLDGHMWVAENVSLRHLRFTPAGAVEDLGSLRFTTANENDVSVITGAIGVTPFAIDRTAF